MLYGALVVTLRTCYGAMHINCRIIIIIIIIIRLSINQSIFRVV